MKIAAGLLFTWTAAQAIAATVRARWRRSRFGGLKVY